MESDISFCHLIFGIGLLFLSFLVFDDNAINKLLVTEIQYSINIPYVQFHLEVETEYNLDKMDSHCTSPCSMLITLAQRDIHRDLFYAEVFPGSLPFLYGGLYDGLLVLCSILTW